MYPMPAGLADALRRSHTVAVRMEVTDAGVTTPLPGVLSGSVKVDRAGAVRRRCDLTLIDASGTLTPRSAQSLLAPYGNEVRLYRGAVLPDGTEAMVPLGVFGISAVAVDDGGGGVTIKIDGYDRARRVQRARFTVPYVIGKGTNVATAIRDLIDSRVPGLTYNLMPTSRTVGSQAVFDRGGDPWDAASDLARNIGAELFFDADGVLVLRPEPDPKNDPVVWEYVEGAGTTMLRAQRKATDAGIYNHVVVSGEPTDAPPVFAEAMDDDPSSPTYVSGEFGDVPYFITSTFIASQAQAQDAAAARLRRVLGSSEQMEVTALVNPAHEAGDVVRVRRGAAGLDALYVLDAFDVPLSAAGVQTMSGRSQT